MLLQIYFPRKQKVMTTNQVDKPRDNWSSPRDVRHMLKKVSESNPSRAIIHELKSKSTIFLRDGNCGNCSSCPRKIRTNFYYTKVKTMPSISLFCSCLEPKTFKFWKLNQSKNSLIWYIINVFGKKFVNILGGW